MWPLRNTTASVNGLAACIQLSVATSFLKKNGGGKCHACGEGHLPCLNAAHGCPKHVRHTPTATKRAACTHHDNAPCPFCPKQVKPPNLSNTSRIASDDGASAAANSSASSGEASCSTRLTQVASLIPATLATIAMDVETSGTAASRSTAHLCATTRCFNLVPIAGLCSSCTDGFLPCTNGNCTSRMEPGLTGVCNKCHAPVSNKRRRVSVGFQACANAHLNCPECVNFDSISADTICLECNRKGPPCSEHPWGCRHGVYGASIDGQCARCVKFGQYCRGTTGRGCGQPIHGVYARRALGNNSLQCEKC